jgi:hypothetical protein
VEAIIRGLVAQQDHERISSLISLLVHDFALSPQSNHRKVQSSRFTIPIRKLLVAFSLWLSVCLLCLSCLSSVLARRVTE